jgi:hypothetical protein
MATGNLQTQKTGDWIFKKLPKLEFFAVILIVIGLVIKMTGIQAGGILLTLSFSSLAVLYFLRAYKILAEGSAMERFYNKLLPYGWSISMIGILYLIQGWPGSQPMMTVSASTQVIIIIAIIIGKTKQPSNYIDADPALLKRSVIITCITLAFYFCPQDVLVKSHIITPPAEIPAAK